jgi:hypothetical protein
MFLRYLLLFLSAAMLAAGYIFGDPAAILTKAVNICLECIGIG